MALVSHVGQTCPKDPNKIKDWAMFGGYEAEFKQPNSPQVHAVSQSHAWAKETCTDLLSGQKLPQ